MTIGMIHDTDEVREVIKARTRALRAKDAATLHTYYASEVISFTLAPPLLHTGHDADSTAAWLDSWSGPLGYEVTQLDVRAGGNIAITHSLDRMRGERADGTVVELWFRCTIGLERQGGDWMITHEHQSVPFYMDDSGRAALDLAP